MRALLTLFAVLSLALAGCFATEDMDEGCSNAEDDDGDGLIDCEDVDCADDPACTSDDDDSAR